MPLRLYVLLAAVAAPPMAVADSIDDRPREIGLRPPAPDPAPAKAVAVPAEALGILTDLAGRARAAEQRSARELATLRHAAITRLEAVRAKLKAAGKATAAGQVSLQIALLKAGHNGGDVQPAPATLISLASKAGQSFLFHVVGDATGGSVWGDGFYTTDSALAAAAVHWGVVADGGAAIVKVTIHKARPAFKGSLRNGVTTSTWGDYPSSYQIERIAILKAPPAVAKRPGAAERRAAVKRGAVRVLADPGQLSGYRGKNGESFVFRVAANKGAGTVWGTDVYTDDSALAAAVVHAGVLKHGVTGLVKVTILPGEEDYEGSVRNGIASSPYTEWKGSYRVERFRP